MNAQEFLDILKAQKAELDEAIEKNEIFLAKLNNLEARIKDVQTGIEQLRNSEFVIRIPKEERNTE
jgi:hypothetical protein